MSPAPEKIPMQCPLCKTKILGKPRLLEKCVECPKCKQPTYFEKINPNPSHQKTTASQVPKLPAVLLLAAFITLAVIAVFWHNNKTVGILCLASGVGVASIAGYLEFKATLGDPNLSLLDIFANAKAARARELAKKTTVRKKSRLIICKQCDTSISPNAETCPSCGEPQKKQQEKKVANQMVGCGCLLFLGILPLIFFTTSRKYGSSVTAVGHSERMAYNEVREHVKQRLKAPSSAKWPGLFESKNHAVYVGGGKYKISSWVDSQNSFGAMRRMNYTAVIQEYPNDKWVLLLLQIDNTGQ